MNSNILKINLHFCRCYIGWSIPRFLTSIKCWPRSMGWVQFLVNRLSISSCNWGITTSNVLLGKNLIAWYHTALVANWPAQKVILFTYQSVLSIGPLIDAIYWKWCRVHDFKASNSQLSGHNNTYPWQLHFHQHYFWGNMNQWL